MIPHVYYRRCSRPLSMIVFQLVRRRKNVLVVAQEIRVMVGMKKNFTLNVH